MSSWRLVGTGLAVGVGASVACFVACGGNEFVAGSGDGGTVVDAGPAVTFCASPDASQFSFCADFDEGPGSLGTPTWSSFNAPGPVTLTLDPDASVSPPDSMLAFAPAQSLTDGGSNAAFVTKNALPKGAIHIAVDVRVDKMAFPSNAGTISSVIPLVYGQGKDYEIFLAILPPTTTATLFSLYLVEVATSPAAAVDAGSPIPHDLTSLLTGIDVTEWQQLKIDLTDPDLGGPVTATVALGTASTKVTLAPPATVINGTRTLGLGLEAVGLVSGAQILFDDVTYGGG